MTGVVERFGALGVFALMVPESACIPVPSELTLIFSGFAIRAGWMSFTLAVLAATGGNLVGSLLSYGLGASRLLDRLPGARSVLRGWDQLLAQRGVRGVFIARLLPLARTFVSLPAGARRVRLIPFVVLTVLGSALWAVAFILVGMAVGSGWEALSSIVGRILLAIGLLVIALSLTRRVRARQRATRSAAR
jgi:membrane protein DedA with SNARE-associated domain